MSRFIDEYRDMHDRHFNPILLFELRTKAMPLLGGAGAGAALQAGAGPLEMCPPHCPAGVYQPLALQGVLHCPPDIGCSGGILHPLPLPAGPWLPPLLGDGGGVGVGMQGITYQAYSCGAGEPVPSQAWPEQLLLE